MHVVFTDQSRVQPTRRSRKRFRRALRTYPPHWSEDHMASVRGFQKGPVSAGGPLVSLPVREFEDRLVTDHHPSLTFEVVHEGVDYRARVGHRINHVGATEIEIQI